MLKATDLGWLSTEDMLQVCRLPPSSSTAVDPDQRFFELTAAYFRLADNLDEPVRSTLYRFKTPWYLTELEELLRHSLLCCDRLLIEAPYPTFDVYQSGDALALEDYYSEFGSLVSCHFTYFDQQTVAGISDLVGDALDYGELMLLPCFRVQVNNDEGLADDRATQYEAGEYYRMFEGMWKKFASCRALQIVSSLESSRVVETGFPVFQGGRLRDLISLRRDEQDAFLQWLRHLDHLNTHSHLTALEVQQALDEGVSELDSRIKLLRRKGTLDLIGVSAVGVGLSVALDAGEMGMLAASIGAIGGAAQATKALIEQQHERALISKSPLHFLWRMGRLPT